MEINFRKTREIYEKVISQGRDVIPVVVQDESSKEVLIMAYVNHEALERALKEGVAAFWSTSRNAMWVKGDTSGQKFSLKKVLVDCEGNSLLFLVEPINQARACHKRKSDGSFHRSCFFQEVVLDDKQFQITRR